MQKVISCSCGAALVGRDDEEIYRSIRQHVDRLHPAVHRPLVDRRSFAGRIDMKGVLQAAVLEPTGRS